MNTTHHEEYQDGHGLFSSARERRALRSFDHQYWRTTTEDEIRQGEFAHRWEEEFARMLDENQIAWLYKHRTFAVEWDEEGNFVDCFTPDFYMPAFDLYVALVASDYRAPGVKARKVRLLRQLHPDIRIELLNTSSPGSLSAMFS